MSFNLAGQMVSPENDGGIQICYESSAKKTTAWNERIPVLSIEVPNPAFSPLHKALINVRQNEKLENIRRTDILYRHVGQIFCEMLGQTYHEQFYTIQEMQYQEVTPNNLHNFIVL